MRNRIGIVSNYIPTELVDLFGTPYRVIGNFGSLPEPALPAFTCTYVRELAAAFNSGSLDFLDGMVIPTSCDSLYAAADLLQRNSRFVFRLATPLKNGAASLEFCTAQYRALLGFFETHYCRAFIESDLHRTIADSNTLRKLLQSMWHLIATDGKQMTYAAWLTLVMRVMQNPAVAMAEELGRLHTDLMRAPQQPPARRRVMLVGPLLDNIPIVDIIERVPGTRIVADSVTNGTRYFQGTVSTQGPPLEALAAYYLGKKHSTTFDNDARYLAGVSEAIACDRVSHVVMINQRGCEPHGFYQPEIRRRCHEKGVGFLAIDIEHAERAEGKVTLAVQSFLEGS